MGGGFEQPFQKTADPLLQTGIPTRQQASLHVQPQCRPECRGGPLIQPGPSSQPSARCPDSRRVWDLCTDHLEAGSPSYTGLSSTDMFLYKMLQKLTSVYITNLIRKTQVSRNCKAHSGRLQVSKNSNFCSNTDFYHW